MLYPKIFLPAMVSLPLDCPSSGSPSCARWEYCLTNTHTTHGTNNSRVLQIIKPSPAHTGYVVVRWSLAKAALRPVLNQLGQHTKTQDLINEMIQSCALTCTSLTSILPKFKPSLILFLLSKSVTKESMVKQYHGLFLNKN